MISSAVKLMSHFTHFEMLFIAWFSSVIHEELKYISERGLRTIQKAKGCTSFSRPEQGVHLHVIYAYVLYTQIKVYLGTFTPFYWKI